MKNIAIVIYCLFLLCAPPSYGFNADVFPESIGPDPILKRFDEIHSWGPDNMFEQVNGEAELLIRYGALSLTLVIYENDNGDYVSVEIIDLGKPINAYGLYRLYAGCDGEEYSASGAIVLADEYTPHVSWERYFLRFNIDTSRASDIGPAVVKSFLEYFTDKHQQQAALPTGLLYLKRMAKEPCEVGYHPEHIDYDLESGPGYAFVAHDGITYFVIHSDTQEIAEKRSNALKDRGVANVVSDQKTVVWTRPGDAGSTEFMKDIINGLNEL